MSPDLLDDWVEVSDHAYERWHQRIDTGIIGPRGAWIEGQKIPVPPGQYGHSARYHHATDSLLIEREDTIVTVLNVQTAEESVKEHVAEYTGQV